MKALIGSLFIAALIMCGPLYISIPVMAGDEASLTRVQWEKLMAQARAQRAQLEQWRRAELQGKHAHKKSSVTKKRNRIAAESTR